MWLTLAGLLSTVLVNLKNSKGQPLVGSVLAGVIPAAESVVTSVVADIAAAKASPQTAITVEQEVLQAIAAILVALKGVGGLSANTLAEITSLEGSLQEALKAYVVAQTVTDPSTLGPIPHAI